MHLKGPRSAIVIVLPLLGALVFALFAMQGANRFYMTQGAARANSALALTLQALDGHLRRFETVPALLADNDRLRTALLCCADILTLQGSAEIAALNDWLAQTNRRLDALDIFVMRPDGTTVAASNFDRPGSFVGQNFSYRPYFQDALGKGFGRFFGVGTTSGVRGYYFAAPAFGADGQVLGVVAVKIGLDAIEAEWRLQEARVLVSDPQGIIFLSSHPDWLFRGLLPLTPEVQRKIVTSRRYADVVPRPLPHRRMAGDGFDTITILDATAPVQDYVLAQQILPRSELMVSVLLPTAAIHAQARLAVLAMMLGLGVAAALAAVVWQRRKRLAERVALAEAAKIELERRVLERTADLARANEIVEAEVAERRATEAELRRTQSDLIQSGKLAALGQMSAALSHEINQPLAAARNYADSAAILLDRGDSAAAKGNIAQILALVDRISTIARHLRNVARKPDAQLKDVPLAPAVAEALALLAPRLEHIAVQVDIPANLPALRGGPVRLQQVLVNLLSNAADAVDDVPQPTITLTARMDAGRVQLMVQDNGAGVPAAIVDRIFDPFFTTKRVGSGLGLGLSISYNIMKDFGGDLRVANAAQGGAVFILDFAAVGMGDAAV